MTHPAAPLLRYLLRPIQDLLQQPTVDEICINEPGVVWARDAGVFVRLERNLPLSVLSGIATLAGALRNQDVSRTHPLLSTELPDGERLQAVLPPAVPDGTVSLTIRKHSKSSAPLSEVNNRYTTTGWNQWQDRATETRERMEEALALFDAGDIEPFLAACVRSRLNMLMVGATGSGKTTMSKSLITAIPPHERIITIEDTLELLIEQPNHVRLLYSKGGQSSAAVTIQDLLEASLRMRPDRVIVQELRDNEAAWVYLNEVMSGHPGSITTIHGRDAAQGFGKLFNLVKSSVAGRGFETKILAGMLADAIDVIVPFHIVDNVVYWIGRVWFVADAMRRGQTAADLLQNR